MKLAVYCSASSNLDPNYYEIGSAFGKGMAKRKMTLVYGGYNEGIMGAVAKEVTNGSCKLIGVIPEIFRSPEFTYDGLSEIIYTDTMSDRKKAMEEISDGFAILPGGIGTMDEFFEIYCLLTLKTFTKPIAMLNILGCYDKLLEFLKQNSEEHFTSEINHNILKVFEDIDKMLDYLEKNQ